MRLWSVHPKYLDARGLVALWREGLLAQKVLLGKTKGYKHHPQLVRFQNCENPIEMIGAYLSLVVAEAETRNYQFDRKKIQFPTTRKKKVLTLSKGQLFYEFSHLLNKLKGRDRAKYRAIVETKRVEPHAIFRVTNGGIADWEKI